MALDFSLKAKTTKFSKPVVLDSFMWRHREFGLAKYLRSITLDLRKKPSTLAWVPSMARARLGASSIKRIELIMAYVPFTMISFRDQRQESLQNSEILGSLVPLDIEEWTVRWPDLDCAVQNLLNNLTCVGCAQLAFCQETTSAQKPGGHHTCSGEAAFTPTVFKQFSSLGQRVLLAECKRRVRSIQEISRLPNYDPGVELLRGYLGRTEYKEWGVLQRLKKELQRLVRRGTRPWTILPAWLYGDGAIGCYVRST